ncbi:MAG TPA: hypothetical protein ENO33_01020 [Hydrogenobaculum sp.]|nr:hypothetical protein [Hydrogenobaculum sp.]
MKELALKMFKLSVEAFKESQDVDQELSRTLKVLSFIDEGYIVNLDSLFFVVSKKLQNNLYEVYPILPYHELASKEDILIIPNKEILPISFLWFANIRNKLILSAGELKKGTFYNKLRKIDLDRLNGKFEKVNYGNLDVKDYVYQEFLEYMSELLKNYKKVSDIFQKHQERWLNVKAASSSTFLDFDDFIVWLYPDKLELIFPEEKNGFAEIYIDNTLFDILEIKGKKATLKLDNIDVEEVKDILRVEFYGF